jgi:cell division protein FtsI (penicillin-binding protein 3)
MDKKKDILWRMYILYIFVVLMGVAVIWKIFQIQFIEGDKWRAKAELMSQDTFLVKPTRGNILAKDTSYMAISVPMYDLRMDTKADKLDDETWNKNVDSLSIQLAYLFKDKTWDQYRNLLSKGRNEKNQYLLVKRNVTRREVELVRKFPMFKLGRFKGGLIEEEKYSRVKPYGNLAARTIGKDSTENTQGLGIEQAFDHYLRGEEGLRLMEKLAGGMWRPVDHENTIEPVDGYDVVTTIDPQLQDVATSELDRQLKMHGASHGCVIVMEVKTGDIAAIANLKKDEDGNYYESFNYAIGEATDPGSTFKLMSAMALLDDGNMSPTDMLSTGDGSITYYGHTVHDSHKNGTISLQQAFEQSSNVFFIKAVMQKFSSNPQVFVDRLKKLHLDKKLNIGLPGEANPIVHEPGDPEWSGLSLAQMAFGYEINISPLQILTVYNAVANNGKMVKPKFVKEIRDRTQVIKTFETEVLEEEVCKPQTASALKKMMEGVVIRGTAKNLNGSVYQIAGKTGTAQIANDGNGYGKPGSRLYRASFCGYFPADNPKYTCIVVVNAPSEGMGYYGNVVAGPIFKAVSDKIYASSFDINQAFYKTEIANTRKQIPTTKKGYTSDIKTVLAKMNISVSGEASGSFSSTTKTSTAVNTNEIVFDRTKIPNVKGMGARDAIYVLEQLGLKVIMVGRGMVKDQSIEPGTSVQGLKIITLILTQ